MKSLLSQWSGSPSFSFLCCPLSLWCCLHATRMHFQSSTSAHSAPRAQPCRYGADGTCARCQFQHLEGRVLPTSSRRGLSAAAPLVNVPTPETGTTGCPSPHKSAKFTNSAASVKEKSEKLGKEKNEMEKDLKLKGDATNKKCLRTVSII